MCGGTGLESPPAHRLGEREETCLPHAPHRQLEEEPEAISLRSPLGATTGQRGSKEKREGDVFPSWLETNQPMTRHGDTTSDFKGASLEYSQLGQEINSHLAWLQPCETIRLILRLQSGPVRGAPNWHYQGLEL